MINITTVRKSRGHHKIEFAQDIRQVKIADKIYFPAVDIIELVVKTSRPRQFWYDYKTNNLARGLPWKKATYQKIVQLKIKSRDGKERFNDCLDPETALIILKHISFKDMGVLERNRKNGEKINSLKVSSCVYFLKKFCRKN